MVLNERPAEDLSGEVRENQKIARNHFRMTLFTGNGFRSSSPGQFLMIRMKGMESPLLGRPMSIYGARPENGGAVVEILYQAVGRGTVLLSRLKSGDRVDLIGPLGRGFDLFPERRRIVLIAGGMGIAPLSFLAEAYRALPSGGNREIAGYIGAQSGACFVGIDRFGKIGQPKLSSDDGSCGHHGLVTDLFEKDLKMYRTHETVVYACGPTAMLKTLRAITDRKQFLCQVSVEERMACGIGACLGCAIRMKNGEYRRVCVDGPVFEMEELEFD